MARNDIRIDISFCDHPKTKRLIRKLGYEAFFSIVKLWSSTARLYQKGILKDCDEMDIADISGWTGDPIEFCNVLTDKKIRFLDHKNGVYSIHDWEVNQPWVYNSDIRSNMARKSVSKRWENKTNTQRIRNVKDSLYESDTPTPTPTPIPSPVPIPSPIPNPIPVPTPIHREKETKKSMSHSIPTSITEITETTDNTDSLETRKSGKQNGVQQKEKEFDRFWSMYPKKKSKGQAEKAWKKINLELHDTIFTALERYKQSKDWTKADGKYIPYPATWLNAKGWEDDIDVTADKATGIRELV